MFYYVYKHVDPRTRETRYIGYGSKARAWACGSSRVDFGKRGNRLKDHQHWIEELLALGYIPSDFVVIVKKKLGREEAKKLERSLLAKHDPKRLFNGTYGIHSLRLTADKLKKARELLATGTSFDQTAALVGVSRMTLWRGLSNRTKALRNV